PAPLTTTAKAIKYGKDVGKTALIGGVSGLGEGDTIEDRLKHGAMGTVLGGALGASLPAVIAGGSAAIRASRMPRLNDPQKIAIEHLTDTIGASKVAPADLVKRVADANAAGQPYAVADALGKEGQRKLASMAKVPGPQRDEITTFLRDRDLNMPARVGGQVERGLGVQGSAE